MEMNTIKAAHTRYPVMDVIKDRWSTRAFSGETISIEELNTLFEAASWAPSANNEQPWIYYYADKNAPGFQDLWNCLTPGNQPWTTNASVLLVACIRKTFDKTGKHNGSAEHDLGLANSHLLLQAISMNIYGHIMGGFDRNKVSEYLELSENIHPAFMLALGKLGNPESLEEPYKSRELAPRSRKQLEEIAIAL